MGLSSGKHRAEQIERKRNRIKQKFEKEKGEIMLLEADELPLFIQ